MNLDGWIKPKLASGLKTIQVNLCDLGSELKTSKSFEESKNTIEIQTDPMQFFGFIFKLTIISKNKRDREK